MKVLYIQSGYGGIYSYFDRWAEECFQNTHTEYMIADKPEAESLMKIEAFQPDFTLMMVGDRVPHDWLTWLKGKDIPVYVWLTEDPFYMDISLQVIKLASCHIVAHPRRQNRFLQVTASNRAEKHAAATLLNGDNSHQAALVRRVKS